MAEGVAHAPSFVDCDADSDRGDDTGGTERRPVTPHEVHHRERVRARLTLSPQHAKMQVRTARTRCGLGERCSRLCVPPAFSSLSSIVMHPEEESRGT